MVKVFGLDGFFARSWESFSPGNGEAESRTKELAEKWRAQAAAIANSLIEISSWDGEWYLRGFFDNGAPLGSHANQEARIDLRFLSPGPSSQGSPQPIGRGKPHGVG